MAGITSWMTVLTSMYWRTIQAYTYISHYYGIYMRPVVSRVISNFVQWQNKEEVSSYYPFRIIKDNDTNLTEIYYPRIQGAEFKFIQVLVEVNGAKHEVNIDDFMVIGNILFADSFTEWILDDQLTIDLSNDDEYTIHIIDQDVNVSTLKKGEFIYIEKDTWQKIQLDSKDNESVEDNESVDDNTNVEPE